ncbi:succinate dehydrogenase / fumarate reductase membrane anchor subunit [Novosphingobium fluoreni]|uniref:Succinate dehydrogenase hydrophobic membrane anchor subunit n=1 Tax=Novosphingobium fluoreni TaxID=1391222 RepID=A0A7W6BX43_9SPHN|nr:succinate dehydrogenase, hydrophobic membrane anchor protein [Novosphingobium fluoreni]KTR82537.1 succinate dehydrogenase [Novosphingobium barchaimii]MBB3939548.1 succinate dehydrogenase / fumarate reductase membrane anchor subunit [Novosphingobium fluoreni]
MGNGTSIGRVRGKGSAHSGAHHWLQFRYTSVGSLLLTVWFGVSLLMLPNFSYTAVREWLASPISATALALFIIVNVWHAQQGLRVVIEDYVHEEGNKFASLIALNLVCFAAAAFGLFCVVRLALGGA